MQYLRRMREEVRAGAYIHVARAQPVGGRGITARARALTRRRLGAADLVEAINFVRRRVSLPYSFVCEVTRGIKCIVP